jgi:hypothetical protein
MHPQISNTAATAMAPLKLSLQLLRIFASSSSAPTQGPQTAKRMVLFIGTLLRWGFQHECTIQGNRLTIACDPGWGTREFYPDSEAHAQILWIPLLEPSGIRAPGTACEPAEFFALESRNIGRL